MEAVNVDPIYFNVDYARSLTPPEFEAHMGSWVNAYGKARLSWTDEDVQSDQPKDINWQLAALNYAKGCNQMLRDVKVTSASVISATCVEPILRKLTSNIASIQKLPIEARAIAMPLTCFLVGFGVESAELSLGHTLIDSNIKRASECKQLTPAKEMIYKSFAVGVRDLKVAAAVSLLKIAAEKGLRASGGYDRLANVGRYLQELFPRCKKDSWLYRLGKNYARVKVYSAVDRMVHGSDRGYVTYLNQPYRGYIVAKVKIFLDLRENPATLHDFL